MARREDDLEAIDLLTVVQDHVDRSAADHGVDVQGGRIVKQTTGKLTPDEGHVHLTLDGKGYVMSYGNRQDFRNVAAGQHSLQAEFVAKDHAPFTNRPRAFVSFNVAP